MPVPGMLPVVLAGTYILAPYNRERGALYRYLPRKPGDVTRMSPAENTDQIKYATISTTNSRIWPGVDTCYDRGSTY